MCWRGKIRVALLACGRPPMPTICGCMPSSPTFLTRARENNFDVPQKKFDAALERLRNLLANSSDIGAGQGAPIAYAAYVLARNGREVMGDLRYLTDAKLDAFESPLARAQLAAALALLGDRPRAEAVFEKASERLADDGQSALFAPQIMARVCAMAPAFSRLPSRRKCPPPRSRGPRKSSKTRAPKPR